MPKRDDIETVIPVGAASPSAYRNVYEKGDEWVKIHGCEGCERPKGSCCGSCPHVMADYRCALHVTGDLNGTQTKPLYCIVNPLPSSCMKGCRLVFRCVKGKNIGKERHVGDADVTFRDPT